MYEVKGYYRKSKTSWAIVVTFCFLPRTGNSSNFINYTLAEDGGRGSGVRSQKEKLRGVLFSVSSSLSTVLSNAYDDLSTSTHVHKQLSRTLRSLKGDHTYS